MKRKKGVFVCALFQLTKGSVKKITGSEGPKSINSFKLYCNDLTAYVLLSSSGYFINKKKIVNTKYQNY